MDSGLQRALLPVSFRERPDAWLSYRQARAFVADMAYREGVCDRGLPITDMARVFNRKLIDPVLGAADLGNAIRQVCITCRAQNSGVRFWLEPNEDMVRLCLLLPLGNNFPGHTISEARTLQLINQLLSEFAGPVFRPSVVQLTSTRHDLLFDPGTVFGDLPVHTGQQRSALVFPRKLLFAQGISARQRAETMPESDACSRMPPAPIGATIDALLEPYLSEGYPHINLAASLMGCSVRTLQRRLTQEGTSYSALIDGVRARAATGRLSQGNCDLPALATSLGYSEHAAFSRAFRRWTGTTPARFRSDHKD